MKTTSDLEPSDLEKHFSDLDNCRREIFALRAAISNKATLKAETFDAAYKTLGFIMLYGPEEIQTFARAQMSETQTRETYFLFSVDKVLTPA